MSTILDQTLGWLGDVVAQHVYVDEVPKTQRRRWNLSAAFLVVDDPTNEWLDIGIDTAAIEGVDDDPLPVSDGSEHPGTEVGLSRWDHVHRFGVALPDEDEPSAQLEWDGTAQTGDSVGLRIQESTTSGVSTLVWLDLWDATVRQATIQLDAGDPDIVTFQGAGSTNIALASNIVYLTATSHISIPNDISILNTGGKTLIGSASSGNTVVVGDGGATLVDIGDGATLVDIGGPIAANTDGGTVATSGSIRLFHGATITHRNAANNGNLNAVETGASGLGNDALRFGNTTCGIIQMQTIAGGTFQVVSGVELMAILPTLIRIQPAGPFQWTSTAAAPTWNQAPNTTAGAVTAQNMLMQAQGCTGNAGGAAKTAGTLDLFGGLVTGTGSVNTSGGVRIRPGLASGGTVDTIGGIDLEIPIGSGVDNWGNIRLLDANTVAIVTVFGGGGGAKVQSSDGDFYIDVNDGVIFLAGDNENQCITISDDGVIVGTTGGMLSFYDGAEVVQPTIAGNVTAITDANAKAVIQSIIAALATGAGGVNLVADTTT